MIITKQELMEMLKDVPDDHKIILASDAEGNNFSPLAEITPAMYVPDTDWYGSIFMADELLPDEENNCVVFWPDY